MNMHLRWSADELKTLHVMRRAGKRYIAISQALGRSESSVKSRALYRGTRKVAKPRPKPEAVVITAPELPTLCILKADLPDLYAKGWRVQGFSGDAVQLVWPHGMKP